MLWFLSTPSRTPKTPQALTIPLQLDLSTVGQQAGDFKTSELGSALDPYLEQIADEMVRTASDRSKTV